VPGSISGMPGTGLTETGSTAELMALPSPLEVFPGES
jgi:hypothetical protein